MRCKEIRVQFESSRYDNCVRQTGLLVTASVLPALYDIICDTNDLASCRANILSGNKYSAILN